jgi:hypothetical protein
MHLLCSPLHELNPITALAARSNRNRFESMYLPRAEGNRADYFINACGIPKHDCSATC